MRVLIAEDDFAGQAVLEGLLSPHGECDIARDGEEAMALFEAALAAGRPYDLVCLDIMMPKLDGKEVLRRVRELEKERGRTGLAGAKILMTTALNDFETIMASFRGQCEGYLVKPISKAKLFAQLRALGLLPADE